MQLYKWKVIFLLVILSLSGFFCKAQPGDPGPDPDIVPITGIELLIGAGALYGASRMLRKEKPDSKP